MTGFVPASALYDVESRTPIAHPATQTTDRDVREAIEAERELVTDGGARVPGASYRVDCWSCGEQIAASSRYCPKCGEVQLQDDDNPEIVTDGGTCREETEEPLAGSVFHSNNRGVVAPDALLRSQLSLWSLHRVIRSHRVKVARLLQSPQSGGGR